MTEAATTLSARKLPRWSWFVIVPIGLILLFVIVLAALPIKRDTPLSEDKWGVGAVNIEPSSTGLLREWPQIGDNFDPKMAKLGYDLFFDPVLSGSNERSCASCHNPDWGFSDPNPRALSPDGKPALRHSPSLWNAAYGESFFWDGRAKTLEEQVKVSLKANLEMDSGGDPVGELSAIPEYKRQFEALFDDGLTEDNIAKVIAAFERTLISDDSAFDRYANGNFEALTTQQRRGLATFRSASTRCFECHSSPLFTDNTIDIVGVPDQDLNDKGQGDAGGRDFAFKVPTLRNVMLHPPFMHNGSEASMEDVIDLYHKGGKDFKLAEVDRRIGGFTLTDQEMNDLVAFMYALTDDTIPEKYWSAGYVDQEGHVQIPESVPSGLAVVEHLDNPAGEALAKIVAAPEDRPQCARNDSSTLTVHEGESIQAAVDCAKPGDTILVEPGVYHERVVIDLSDITLQGIADEPEQCPLMGSDHRFPEGDDAPNWPVLDGDVDGDGEKDLTDGVIASGNNFKMQYFIVRNYTGNGILVEGVTGVTLRQYFTTDTGIYGAYPVHSTNVLVECAVSTKIHDAAIYVGQSQDIVVRHSLAYDSVTGIEIENSVNADVYENEAWDNIGGLLVFLLPNLSSKVSHDIHIHDNYVHDNNREKGDARPGSTVTLVPSGTGIILIGTDDSEVYNNRVENNNSIGVGVASLYIAFKPEQIGNEIGPLAERNRVYNNIYINNGNDPSDEYRGYGLPGADVLWDATGYGNTFDETGIKMFPPVLASSKTPGLLQRIIYQIWSLASKVL